MRTDRKASSVLKTTTKTGNGLKPEGIRNSHFVLD